MAEEAKKSGVTQQDQKPQEGGADAGAADTGTPAGTESAAEGGRLSMTQAELDALVEKRLARERRKWEKAGVAKPAPAAATADAEPAAAGAEGAGAPDNSAALAAANRELAAARARLAAITAGVRPDMAEDAVCLALRDAEKSGEAEEGGLEGALNAVLERHPEWKWPEQAGGSWGGFRLGTAEKTGPAGTAARPGSEADPTVRSWNRFNHL